MAITRVWSINGTTGRQEVACTGTYADASPEDLAAHEADSTAVHGITDSSKIVVSDDIDDIDVVTQAAYDALGGSVVATRLYVIVG